VSIEELMSQLPSWVDHDRVMAASWGDSGALWFEVIEDVPPPFTGCKRVPHGYQPRHDEQVITTILRGAWVTGRRTTKTVRFTRDGDGWVRSTDGARLGPGGQPR
jgi:hypothetical protein